MSDSRRGRSDVKGSAKDPGSCSIPRGERAADSGRCRSSPSGSVPWPAATALKRYEARFEYATSIARPTNAVCGSAAASDIPTAVAFVDLTGFTQLTEQHGDRTAAAVAARFADMAREVVGRRQGRLVKQLGDGVLVRYPSAVASVEATLALLDAMAASDLPAGHAGVDAGPLVTRDADVFGRAVNRASRLATIATPGELIATATFADSLPAGQFQAEPMGAVELKGISHPTEVVRLSRPA